MRCEDCRQNYCVCLLPAEVADMDCESPRCGCREPLLVFQPGLTESEALRGAPSLVECVHCGACWTWGEP
jgi:hypothetical protein